MRQFNVRKRSIFYGWWIVIAVTLIAAITGGTAERGFTAIFQPISNTFGWSYMQVSFAASIRAIALPVLIPIVGFLFDRWGPRRWIFLGIIISGLSVIFLSHISSLTGLYVWSFVLALGISTSTGMLPTVVVSNWFRKRNGLATSIVLCGGAMGGVMVPVMSKLIDIFEWRNAMFFTGLGIIFTCLPLSILVRHKPEQYGYLPDGEYNNDLINTEGFQNVDQETSLTLIQAIKNRSLWHLVIAMACTMIASNSIAVHVMPYLSSVGISKPTASFVAMAIPLIQIFPLLFFGWLADILNKKLIGTIACFLGSLGVLIFVYVNVKIEWLILLFLIIYGIGTGGFVPILVVLQRQYFGRPKLGTIMGFISGLGVLGGMIGPPLAGWFYDRFGSYQYAWIAIACIAFTGAIAIATAPATHNIITVRER